MAGLPANTAPGMTPDRRPRMSRNRTLCTTNPTPTERRPLPTERRLGERSTVHLITVYRAHNHALRHPGSEYRTGNSAGGLQA